MGEVGAVTWEVAAGSVGSTGADGIGDNCVSWPGEGLALCWDEALWPPQVFTMSPN